MRKIFLFLVICVSAFFSSVEAQKTIGIFTFANEGVGAWDPDKIHSGISGSEEAVIYMSEQLAILGYQVTVFGNPPKDSKYSASSANPRFTTWDVELPAKLDIGIVWRIPQAGERLRQFAHTLYFWPHDDVTGMVLTKEQIHTFDDVLWISHWQRKSWIAQYPEFSKFTHITGNGINPKQFHRAAHRENPYSCIYASNYARGLDKLLAIWPQIKAQFPKATLDIYYGWKHWGLLSAEKELELKKQVKDLEALGVQEHGMVGHEALVAAFEKASFWTYPCTAVEAFCITALKAQLAGAVPVVCKNTGLLETCPNGFACSDVQEYAHLLIKAMESAEQIPVETREKIGEFVLEEFTWGKIAHKWQRIFEASSSKNICLNMVVKNHKDTIAQCLNSIKDKIDYWVLVDEGSNDGTIEIAKKILEKIPGELHLATTNDPQKEALSLAQKKAEYLLVMDPQEELFFSEYFTWPSLDKDYYFDYAKNKKLLIKSSSQGQISSTDPKKYQVLPGVIRSSFSQPLFNPNLHLAQSYIEAKEYTLAKKILGALIQTNPENIPLFSALYIKGMASELAEDSFDEVIQSYSAAFTAYPNKAEPLFRMSVYTCRKGHYALAYALAKEAASIPHPRDSLGSEDWIYDYGLVFNLGHCAYQMKKYEEAKSCFEKVSKYPSLPENVKQEILSNLSLPTLTGAGRSN
ncbi:MAG: tetratricopeptide repeat protein [Rhabdochlamydiaceae bacterium]|nr:tetratricopeptide repeat protein [Rhabdochlamydiaceae bacterium]